MPGARTPYIGDTTRYPFEKLNPSDDEFRSFDFPLSELAPTSVASHNTLFGPCLQLGTAPREAYVLAKFDMG